MFVSLEHNVMDQSQVILVSKVVKATATPWMRLKGSSMSRLYTSGPAFPKIRRYLSWLSKASVMTKFLMLDSLALPLKDSTQDCSSSLHFACLFRHLSIFSRQFSSPQQSSRYLKGTSALGRQMCMRRGPPSPRKLDSQQMVALLYFSCSRTSVQRLPRKVDSRAATRMQLPWLSRRQKTYSQTPSFRTVRMCCLPSCSRTWYSVIPERLFLSRWISHCIVYPFASRSKIDVLSMQNSDRGMDLMDLLEGLEGLEGLGGWERFSSMSFTDWISLLSTLSFHSSSLILLACLTSWPLKFSPDWIVQLPWLPSSRIPQSSLFKSSSTSAFFARSWKLEPLASMKPLSSMMSPVQSKRRLFSSSTQFCCRPPFSSRLFLFLRLAIASTVFSTARSDSPLLDWKSSISSSSSCPKLFGTTLEGKFIFINELLKIQLLPHAQIKGCLRKRLLNLQGKLCNLEKWAILSYIDELR